MRVYIDRHFWQLYFRGYIGGKPPKWPRDGLSETVLLIKQGYRDLDWIESSALFLGKYVSSIYKSW